MLPCTCMTLANMAAIQTNCVDKLKIIPPLYSPHGLKFLLAAIQIVIQNSKGTISITMCAPAGDRTFFCGTNTKAIIIVIYIYEREIQNSATKLILFASLFYYC